MMQKPSLTELCQSLDPRLSALLHDLGAQRVPHSKRTLAEHLVGTYRLLSSWGNDEAVCRAGLFHSIYGTRVFEIQCVDFSSRERVRDIIGVSAESLAYYFCLVDRDSFFNGARTTPHVIRNAVENSDLTVTRGELASLLEIEAANVVEQLPRRSRETRRDMRRYRNAFTECRGFLSPEGADAIARALETYAIDVPSHALP